MTIVPWHPTHWRKWLFTPLAFQTENNLPKVEEFGRTLGPEECFLGEGVLVRVRDNQFGQNSGPTHTLKCQTSPVLAVPDWSFVTEVQKDTGQQVIDEHQGQNKTLLSCILVDQGHEKGFHGSENGERESAQRWKRPQQMWTKLRRLRLFLWKTRHVIDLERAFTFSYICSRGVLMEKIAHRGTEIWSMLEHTG